MKVLRLFPAALILCDYRKLCPRPLPRLALQSKDATIPVIYVVNDAAAILKQFLKSDYILAMSDELVRKESGFLRTPHMQ